METIPEQEQAACLREDTYLAVVCIRRDSSQPSVQFAPGMEWSPAPTKPPTEDTRQSVSGHAPVERAAARDSVGDQVQTTRAPKCTFSGVVPIEAKRFLDSGTRLVECPDCAAMRSLDLQKGMLRFKSHDKRKTTTPILRNDGSGLIWSGMW